VSQPRRGLVLGGGGVLGATWMVGALRALEDELGVDLRTFESLVGTSAGSVLAGLLGAGVAVEDLVSHQLGRPVTAHPLAGYSFDYEEASGGDRPSRPRAGIGSSRLLVHNARQLRHLPPTAVLSAFLPEGRGRLDTVGALVSHVVPHGWAPRPGVTVVALDYDTGARVAFGAAGVPEADLPTAVMASCAIPGWYQPVRIGDHRFIDGGAWSSTNIDLVAGLGLDEVYVLAPQVSFDADHPSHLATRLERQWRTRVTARALREVAKVHRHGTDVTVLGPGPDDLEAMGANLMEVARRPHVLETSLRTSVAALRDPAPLPVETHFEDAG
jgi:NTE family protein